MRNRWIVLAIAGLLVAACVPTTTTNTTTRTPTTTVPSTATVPATTTAQVFRTTLNTVNRSGVTGEATVTVQGSELTVQVTASGMVPNQVHAQHIHGFPGGRVSSCPPEAAPGTVTQEPDAEKTGYGPVLVPLEPFPKADASGRVTYSATVAAASVVPTIPVLPLAGREVVLHGLMVGGKYEPGVPVACGTLTPVSTPPTSTVPTATVPTTSGSPTGNETGNTTGNETNSTGNGTNE